MKPALLISITASAAMVATFLGTFGGMVAASRYERHRIAHEKAEANRPTFQSVADKLPR
jgi:hypothetical protein